MPACSHAGLAAAVPAPPPPQGVLVLVTYKQPGATQLTVPAAAAANNVTLRTFVQHLTGGQGAATLVNLDTFE